MSNQEADYKLIGWIVAGVIGFIFVIFVMNVNANHETNTVEPNIKHTYSQPATTNTTTNTEPSNDPQPDDSWHCVDATSYNQNAYDDNKCTKGDEVRYVSDSEAVSLDRNYSPGKSGASYYNNK